mgnify:CR=1 FL=1
MNYNTYELTHAMLAPFKAISKIGQMINTSPLNPVSYSPIGRSVAAAFEVFNRATHRYEKPQWGIETTEIENSTVDVSIDTVLSTNFCNLLHFKRDLSKLKGKRVADPKVLIVAPLSGHYATLLRDTVQALLPDHDIYVTDWLDARDIPVSKGSFDLEDQISLMIDFMRFLGPDVSVMAVCQPAVSVLAAVSVMAAENDPMQPNAMILMAGPIDARVSPTKVNQHAEDKELSWFENMVISHVPFPQQGAMRKVYPGFVQLSGFMAMNIDRHMESHSNFYNHLVEGDGDSAEQHRKFYDEYLSVMDLTAEFFIQTIDLVFKEYALPRGLMTYRGKVIDPGKIKKTALMTIEGVNDDICGLGQTGAAIELCSNIPGKRKLRHVQEKVGHYGVSSGKRWRTEIKPRIAEFIRSS